MKGFGATFDPSDMRGFSPEFAFVAELPLSTVEDRRYTDRGAS